MRNGISSPLISVAYCVETSRYLVRYKNAAATNAGVGELVEELRQCFMAWDANSNTGDSNLSDEVGIWQSRIAPFIEKNINRLLEMIGRSNVIRRVEERRSVRQTDAATVDYLGLMYVGPGTERPDGPRHDNDHVDINDISIPPTHDELTCAQLPYLPYNLPGAPHSYPSSSMQRLLDIHFRLLREELM